MTSGAGSYIEIEITKPPEKLVGTPMYGQCMARDAGSYIKIKITKSPVELVGTPMYGKCMTSDAGSCIESQVTKSPVVLVESPVYGQCTASNTRLRLQNSQNGCWITSEWPVTLAHTLALKLQYHQRSWWMC